MALSTEDRSEVSALERVLRTGAIEPVFQPIVELDSGDVVAYQAFARGPEDLGLATPDRLFSVASAAGRVVELDRLCRAAAIESARRAGLVPALSLFVKAEPEVLDRPVAVEDDWEPVPGVRCFVEVTERVLASRPADLLRALAGLRERGYGIVLADVGVGSDSLAFLPFLDPDVVALDLRVLGGQPYLDAAPVVHAVAAQAERTGALVMAVGVEDDDDLRRALAMGAHLAMGQRFGLPGPPPARLASPAAGVGLLRPPAIGLVPTPYELVAARVAVRRVTKRVLLDVVRLLEEEATTLELPPVVLSTFEDATLFTPGTRRRYARLAEQYAFVGALGEGMELEPAAGVRGADLAPDDPVRGEWDVVVVSDGFAAAVVARDLGDGGPDMARRFDYALTFQRDLVVAAARSLMSRIGPAA